MLTIAEIRSALVNQRFTKDEIAELHKCLRYASNRADSAAITELQIGDHVSFENRCQKYTGSVTRIKSKYVIVRTDDGANWNVPAGFLTKVQPVTV